MLFLNPLSTHCCIGSSHLLSPLPGIATWLLNFIQVSAQMTPLQEGLLYKPIQNGSLTSVMLYPHTPSTHPSYTHSQPPPLSACDSLSKPFSWPRAVFILAQRGCPWGRPSAKDRWWLVGKYPTSMSFYGTIPRPVLHSLPVVPCGTVPQFPTEITYPITHPLLDPFISLSHLLTFLPVFPGITFPINHLHSNVLSQD